MPGWLPILQRFRPRRISWFQLSTLRIPLESYTPPSFGSHNCRIFTQHIGSFLFLGLPKLDGADTSPMEKWFFNMELRGQTLNISGNAPKNVFIKHGWNIGAPPKFKKAPEKWWLEDYFPIGKGTFQGRTVKLREGITSIICQSVNTVLVWLRVHLVFTKFYRDPDNGGSHQVLANWIGARFDTNKYQSLQPTNTEHRMNIVTYLY